VVKSVVFRLVEPPLIYSILFCSLWEEGNLVKLDPGVSQPLSASPGLCCPYAVARGYVFISLNVESFQPFRGQGCLASRQRCCLSSFWARDWPYCSLFCPVVPSPLLSSLGL
jgi:hypothetical protein